MIKFQGVVADDDDEAQKPQKQQQKQPGEGTVQGEKNPLEKLSEKHQRLHEVPAEKGGSSEGDKEEYEEEGSEEVFKDEL